MHNEIGRASTRRRADGRSSPVQQDFGNSRRTICYPGGERRRRTAHRFEKGSETMNSKTIKLTTFAGIGALMLSGCVTDPVTGERKISKAAIGGVGGALGGYLLGDLIGGKNSRTEEIVGAGIGAVAGAGAGYYMDQQEKKLRERTAGTGIDVERQGDQLRSEEHTSELQSLMRISYAVFC